MRLSRVKCDGMGEMRGIGRGEVGKGSRERGIYA